MGSGAVTYVPSFIKIGSGIEKLIRGYTHRQQRDLISLLYFFQNKESRLTAIIQILQEHEFKFHNRSEPKTNKNHINQSQMLTYFSCIISAPHLALQTIDTATPSGGRHLQAVRIIEQVKYAYISLCARVDKTLARTLQNCVVVRGCAMAECGPCTCRKSDVTSKFFDGNSCKPLSP
jgi:hypothetical protein